jgi:hypothetical protein
MMESTITTEQRTCVTLFWGCVAPVDLPIVKELNQGGSFSFPLQTWVASSFRST